MDLGLAANALTAIRYAGQFIDPVAGLSFNRARWYDPASGSFMQRDPYRGSLESPLTMLPYLYGNGNPTNMTDPSGNFSILELVINLVGTENVEKMLNSAKAFQGSAQAAKWIIRILLLTFAVETTRTFGFEHPFATALALAYYGYEEIVFERTYKSQPKTLTLAGESAFLAKYLAALPGAAATLEKNGISNPGPLPRGGFADFQSQNILITTFIPLTGHRSYDNYLSYGVAGGSSLIPVFMALVSGNLQATGEELGKAVAEAKNIFLTRFGTRPKLTWHHNEIMGVMELIRTNVHQPVTHIGSIPLWEIINDKDYEGGPV